MKKERKTSYPLAILLSTVSTALPVASMVWLVFSLMGIGTEDTMIPSVVFFICLAQWIVFKAPLHKMYNKAVQDNEYDEFGNSKKKSYENLTRKEREEMDLQKAAKMEQLLSSSVLKKITKKGSADPEKDLQSLIGIASVKQKTTEMVARMKFEQDTKKKRGKNKDHSSNSMSGRHFVFYGSAGTGKAQPLYSKVLTPNGFVNMGEIKVGDTVISGTNKQATVLGVYPQGKKDIYEITFDDGSTCRCCDEHLWTVQTDKDRTYNKSYRTISLNEIRKTLMVKHGETERKNYSIDYVSPIDFEEKDFYIHPYLLGLLIGDGCFENDCVSISLYDEELRKTIYSFFPDKNYRLSLKSQKCPDTHDYAIVYDGKDFYHFPPDKKCANLKPLNYHLALLGLRGCKRYEKFIPTEYLYASKEQRRWLLKGLLDTDGYADRGNIEFSTVSEKLKDNIIELVHSLGGYASFKEKQGYYRKNGEKIRAKKYYRICIQFTADNKDCFNLKRKAEAYNPKRSSAVMKRYIANVKYVGKEECQCIYIDDPSHLYITDNYIITHNTTVARIITGFLYKFGYIKENKCIEIDGNFLKAGEDSATKTRLIIQKAYGGVLFIDEAYTIVDGSGGYGKEVVATLIKEMEDNRDKLIVILAGYKHDMKRLLDTNEGFKSRIKEYLEFPDYNNEEMKEIFVAMAHSENFVVSGEALLNLEVRLEKERKLSSFGNGRTARNILDETIDRHALNYGMGKLAQTEIRDGKEVVTKTNADNKFVLCGCDVSTSVNKNVL